MIECSHHGCSWRAIAPATEAAWGQYADHLLADHSKTVEADIPENPLTVNLLSRNSDRYFTITHAMRTLDYAPKDDSSEVVERHS